MAQYISKVGYGLSEALPVLADRPIKAKRIPTTADVGYSVGQIWVNTTAGSQAAYLLLSVLNNSATWLNIAVASGAAFTTLSSTGAFTLDTTTAAANTLGNTTGATSITSLVGTGGYTVDGVPSSNYDFGASTTTGTISIGGSAQTGTFTLAGGTGAQTINIAAAGTGAKTINIGATGSVDVITIGSTTGASALNLNAGSGDINIVGGVALTGGITATGGVFANSIAATGDGGGFASETTLTNASVPVAGGTGVMVVQTTSGAGTTASAGFLKLYLGATAVYVPYWTQTT